MWLSDTVPFLVPTRVVTLHIGCTSVLKDCLEKMYKSELTSMFASSQIYIGTRFTLETIAWFTQE